MKYLQGKRNFDLVVCESDIQVPVNNQVLVKVLACGICGTDLHYLKSREEYTPLGHEISAIVVSQGNAVTKVSVGDMVVVEDAAPCGHCTYCKNNEHYLCRNTLGLNGQSGMGEYILVHENNLVLCKNLTREQATFVEPAAVALTACMNAQIREDRPLIIWGVGPLALMCVAIGKYYHAEKIICISHGKSTLRSRKRIEAAYELGATEVMDARTLESKRDLWSNANSVIVSSPPSTVPDAVRLSGYGSTIVPFGVAFDDSSKVTLDIDDMILNKKRLIPVLTEPSSLFPRCIRLIEEGIIPTEKLLTHQIYLTDTDHFRSVYQKDEAVIKGIIVNE